MVDRYGLALGHTVDVDELGQNIPHVMLREKQLGGLNVDILRRNKLPR
jgi:hypothetical protein